MAERGPPQSNSSPELDAFNSMYDSLKTAIAYNIGSVTGKAVSAFLITPQQLAECTNRHLPSCFNQADRFLQIIKAVIQSSSNPGSVLKGFIGVLRQELTLVEKAAELERTLELFRRRQQLKDADDDKQGSGGPGSEDGPPGSEDGRDVTPSNMGTSSSVDNSGGGTADTTDSSLTGQQQGSSKPDEDQTQGQLGGDNRWWCVCL